MTEPTCFTVAELAARWKYDKRLVSALIKDKMLKSFTIGTRDRVTLTEVRRFEGEEGIHETHEEQALAVVERLRSQVLH